MVQEEQRIGLVSVISFLVLVDDNDKKGGVLLWIRARTLKVIDKASSAALSFTG